VNSSIGAAPGLKIRAGDMKESNSAVGLEHISSGGFNRRIAWVIEFRHRGSARTEDPVLASRFIGNWRYPGLRLRSATG
jgi:hypothetical protein